MSRFTRRLQQAAASKQGVSVPRLYITPSMGTYSVGSTITMTIREDSQAIAVNAIQANLTYPAARLEFTAASITGGAFTTTIENTGGSGSVKVAVALLGGSVIGDKLVATITFKVLTTGSAAVSFAVGSAIASAADSVDICELQQGATYTLT